MKRHLLIIFCLCMLSIGGLWAQRKNQAYLEYIDTYKSIAIEQQREHGIPASITLAQGLLESNAGRSELARTANNHFGIKYHDGSSGKWVCYDDDYKNERFRCYDSPEESYEDHSAFLKRDRYSSLFELKITDYQGWAKGLKKCGYATDKSYADKLIQLIELYELYQYDKVVVAVNEEPKESQETQESHSVNWSVKGRPIRVQDLPPEVVKHPHPILSMWGLRCVEVRQGDNLAWIAAEFRLSLKQLAKYNDIPVDYAVKAGEIIYLEKKHKQVQEGNETYVVCPNETMHVIAQRNGIRLKNLYKLNKLSKNYTPKVGDVLRLR